MAEHNPQQKIKNTVFGSLKETLSLGVNGFSDAVGGLLGSAEPSNPKEKAKYGQITQSLEQRERTLQSKRIK